MAKAKTKPENKTKTNKESPTLSNKQESKQRDCFDFFADFRCVFFYS